MTTSAPVVLVHGLRTSASMWRAQAEALTSRGIPFEAIDLPGHGTRMAQRFTAAAASDAIGSTVARVTAEHGAPYLVGFSLGGYLAIDWVARHPGEVVGLLAASCGTVPHPQVMGGWRMIARAIHSFPDRGLWLNNTVVRSVIPRPGADDVIAGGVALEVMDDVLRMLPGLDPVGDLARIAEPVLFVNGSLDHIRWHASRYLAAAAGSRLITIHGASHMVSVARPEMFTAVMLEGRREAIAVSTRVATSP